MIRSNKWTLFALILAVGLPALACEPPVTTYRRSALTPSALGVVGTTPVKKGQVQVGGSISAIDAYPKTPVEGDSAMHVAERGAVAHLRAAVGEHVTIGGQLQGAHREWSALSADGTPPLREGLAWGVGPNISVHVGQPEGLSLGASMAVTYMNVPWAAWEIDERSAKVCPPCDGQTPLYNLRDSGRESMWLYRAAIGPNYNFNEHFGVFTGVSIQNTMTNIGFDNTPRAGSTIDNGEHFLVGYFGLTARTSRGLYAQGQLFLTDGHRPTLFSPGLQLTLGMNL